MAMPNTSAPARLTAAASRKSLARRLSAGSHTCCLGGRRRLGRLLGRSRRGPSTGPSHLFLGQRPTLERVVARRDMAFAKRVQRRVLDVAVAFLKPRAARVEVARRRRVEWAR